ncbi:Uncharacterised protein [Mycobacteroides abscessus subsp. abscessus]|nr:Uncharacterised protein [Mycobacteroides abscessus subsp. abscessus]
MQSILFQVSNFQYGLRIMYFRLMVQERLWQYLDMMNVIMNLQKNLSFL